MHPSTQFHTEALGELLEDDDRFGFIVMDGNGTLYGTLQVRRQRRRRAAPASPASPSSRMLTYPTLPPQTHHHPQGNTRTVLHKFSVDLPKKHGRGGQSAVRFARLRMEARHNYVRKV